MLNTGLTSFMADEAGAVTVDWVVLAAGTIAFGLLVVSTIASGATDASTGLGAELSAADMPVVDFD